jgi:RecJ-like exonuclease
MPLEPPVGRDISHVCAIEEALMADDKDKGSPEEVAPGTPGSGENVCRRCEGKGKLADGGACPDCNGTGKVSTPIGGA